jgi:hypothetical protein
MKQIDEAVNPLRQNNSTTSASGSDSAVSMAVGNPTGI